MNVNSVYIHTVFGYSPSEGKRKAKQAKNSIAFSCHMGMPQDFYIGGWDCKVHANPQEKPLDGLDLSIWCRRFDSFTSTSYCSEMDKYLGSGKPLNRS
jgi:hypothetical protein